MEFTLDEITKLKNLLIEKEQELLDEFQGKKVLGFSLAKCYNKTPKGNKYVVWRAHACKNAVKAIVNIGKDPRDAEEKIKAYLEKNPKWYEKKKLKEK